MDTVAMDQVVVEFEIYERFKWCQPQQNLVIVDVCFDICRPVLK